ncbi:MAG: hypothetical protein HC853_16120 [Anaerolineae bacterium]|nr:hypothetical protein [Anaerolineae bacterium]
MTGLARHIHIGKLIDLLEGRLSSTERARIEAHLAACSQCNDERAELKRLIGLMRTDAGENAPPPLIQRVVQMFNASPQPESPLSILRRRIVAALRFDSLGFTPVMGVRSDPISDSGARQMLFNAEAHELDVRIEPDGELWAVSGQIFGETTPNAPVTLQNPHKYHHNHAQPTKRVRPAVRARRSIRPHLATGTCRDRNRATVRWPVTQPRYEPRPACRTAHPRR